MATAESVRAAISPKKSPAANKKRRGKKKKKRISKHVLKAKESLASGGQEGSASENERQNVAATHSSNVKDPSDVYAYLTGWKSSGGVSSREGGWKFNKNTQNWLIRHAYDFEKVPKASFTLLMEYLAGLKGDDTKKRLLSDATRRAMRYKEYETQAQQQQATVSSEDAETKQDDQKAEENEIKEKLEQKQLEDARDTGEDRARWEKLSDHDKRKEYKRARKILDCFRE
mmetsp:Transcript_20398/g.44162  ORF Transcript_20398/g.44162 Transcript_20398/m.44162 type:complete len:229 (+) Transcript_20398:74-760(+)